MKTNEHKIRRVLVWTLTTIIMIAAGIFIFSQISPWPRSLLIRHELNENGRRQSEELEPFLHSEISTVYDLNYRENDKEALLDVHFPDSISTTVEKLPTIVWIHGGGWVSGSKEIVGNYCRMLAGKGYTVAAIDYSVAPEYTYPTPVIQANAALDYLNKNFATLHIDSGSMIIAGDSGGAQIAAQLANIISEPAYAAKFNIKSALKREQLRAVLLFCGAYDLNDIKQADSRGPGKDFLRTVFWAYTGTRNFIHDPEVATASVADYVTPAFPPAFISVGNADPLASQSYMFARKLARLNVKVDTLFFPNNYKPLLPHEYQFDFNNAAGKMALEKATAFLSSTVKNKSSKKQ
ncbi:Acetyl esterase/lipase [Chryseobacterium rhizoplanae]|uniref:Acetyl esterase/lipase n=1 Tax=Chryseobacterium rhizoplanae TaxID=1609531 RepID=A0A521DJR6_9FLAO|nr:alpha/beta hydrolase [Chryseobacterium rhizoplanae]SMO71926.1 Acetyl esterase/lipase [Chryseobacterium rhizoplanae]